MFSFIKSLFRETRPADLVPKSSNVVASEPEKNAAPQSVESTPKEAARPGAGEFLDVPLCGIVARFPAPLRQKVGRTPVPSEQVRLRLPAILPQLSSGSVKVLFSELKASAPAGAFTADTDLDTTPVDIPLSEILPRLKPSFLARRAEQKPVRLSPAIASVFRPSEISGGAKRFSQPVSKPEIIPERDDLKASRLLAAASSGATFADTRPSLIPEEAAPANTVKPVAAAEGSTAGETRTVKITLASVARDWPEPMRHEILDAHLAAWLQIPFSELEKALAQGRAHFKWRTIREWLAPQPATAESVYDDTVVDLPLSVLIPPFLARRSTTAAPKKPAVGAEIPDIFVARPPSDPASAPPAKPAAPAASAPAQARPQTASPRPSGAAVPAGLPAVEAAIKMPTVASSATMATVVPAGTEPPIVKPSGEPKDVIQRVCRLSGVAGALVATHDGLVIASQLPAGMPAETAAAFLPQVYNRLSQYARELKLDEPTEVAMLLGKTPFEIFKTSNVYFAVLGQGSEPLPKVQLSVLAGQIAV